MKYLRMCKNLENTEYFNFYSNIYELMTESKLELSIPKLLLNASIPLSIEKWKKKSNHIQNLSSNLKKFCESQLKDTSKINDESYISKNSMKGQQYFEKIIDLFVDSENYLNKILAHLKLLQLIGKKEI